MYVSISPKMNNNVTYPLKQSYILPLINYKNNLDITDGIGCLQIHGSTFFLNAWVNHTSEVCLPGVSTLTASLSTNVDDNASSVATTLSDLRVKNLNKIIIAQLNINSLRNKFDFLVDSLNNYIDTLLIVEIKLNDSFPMNQSRIDNFQLYMKL